MSLIKDPVFKSLQQAMDTLSQLCLAPSKDGEVCPEYECYLEEHSVVEDNITFDLIALWGVGDVFFLHNKYGNDDLTFIDHVHQDDPSTYKEIPLTLQLLLKRCMLVGYVPANLLSAIAEMDRKSDYQHFYNEHQELVHYTYDVVESFEEAR